VDGGGQFERLGSVVLRVDAKCCRTMRVQPPVLVEACCLPDRTVGQVGADDVEPLLRRAYLSSDPEAGVPAGGGDVRFRASSAAVTRPDRRNRLRDPEPELR